MIEKIFYLLFAHALADFVFQNDNMARYKNLNNMPVTFAGVKGSFWWMYFLSAHALIHGGLVGLVLGWKIGILDTVIHWLVDFGKCKRWYGTHLDQSEHLLIIILWSII